MKPSHRENLLSLLRRQGYAFAPLEFSLCQSQQARFQAITGQSSPAEYFGFSARHIAPVACKAQDPNLFRKYYGQLKPGATIDRWGVAHEPGSEAAFHMTYMRHPLEHAQTVEDILQYEFPDFLTQAPDRREAEQIQNNGFAAAVSMETTIWETAWYLRGMENLMVDMLEEDEKATVLLDIITKSACHRAACYAHCGVDILKLGDDIGMQHSIMMSQTLFRTWLKPRLKQVIHAAKAINPDLLIQYHSCGYVEPFIPDLIEIGVDVLNPVQPECMDFTKLHAQYGDRLSFCGTLGTQTTLPFGTAEEVAQVVEQNLRLAGAKGGLLCCPTHLVEPEVPWENLLAYVEACKGFRC